MDHGLAHYLQSGQMGVAKGGWPFTPKMAKGVTTITPIFYFLFLNKK
jgi:hypothetical protein